MNAPLLTYGDPVMLTLTVYDAGAAYSLAGATIAAAIQDAAGTQIVAPVTQSSSTTGADWTNGVLVISMPSAGSSLPKPDNGGSPVDVWLEIQITTSGGIKRTPPLIRCAVQLGTIA